MQTKSFGFILIVIGVVMMIYTGFNYVTTEKVVDLGSVQINKEKNNFVEWSPIVGLILLVGGLVVVMTSSKRVNS
jgi:uncharacterized membrane protein YidH (DUF202 family)